jgi:hypothetical protein
MTSIGTGIAAAVAQTALQAQQTARVRDKAQTQSARDAKRLHELLQTAMQALEEGDQFESPAQLHVDSQMPQHQSPQENQDKPKRPSAQAKPEETVATTSTPASSTPNDGTLYRHLDVKA